MFGKKPRLENPEDGAEEGFSANPQRFPDTNPPASTKPIADAAPWNAAPWAAADAPSASSEGGFGNRPPVSPPPSASHSASPSDTTVNLPILHPTAAQDRAGSENLSQNQALIDLQQQQQVMEQQRKKALEGAASRPVSAYSDKSLETPDFIKARGLLSDALIDKVDFQKIDKMLEEDKRNSIQEIILKLMERISIPLTASQQEALKKQLMDEALGFGPLEVLLADPEVSDIMVNGPNNVYVEKAGKISRTDVKFVHDKHLLNIIQKIVQRVGRRVDETSPMVDARMPDGSRFNAIIPPLALDGCLVSIRKFKKNKMPLRQYVEYNSCTLQMARFLEICGAIRLNILISGGTGSGKTTLLNALSGHIDVTERVITIEDAAELQLHQPHVLRLESRPSNSEGVGEITQRQLVKNALRMRPDRIILGEIRGDEVIDVLQAMNTGHDGSMATIHANNPRECLTRLENLFGLTGLSLPLNTLRAQIAGSIQMIVQVSRMRDGGRRITHIEEIVGMESGTITTQTLFSYKATGLDENGKMRGDFVCHGIKPRFYDQAAYFNKEKEMAEVLGMLGGMGGRV
jgi:pilus assembly protein CpaF